MQIDQDKLPTSNIGYGEKFGMGINNLLEFAFLSRIRDGIAERRLDVFTL